MQKGTVNFEPPSGKHLIGYSWQLPGKIKTHSETLPVMDWLLQSLYLNIIEAVWDRLKRE